MRARQEGGGPLKRAVGPERDEAPEKEAPISSRFREQLNTIGHVALNHRRGHKRKLVFFLFFKWPPRYLHSVAHFFFFLRGPKFYNNEKEYIGINEVRGRPGARAVLLRPSWAQHSSWHLNSRKSMFGITGFDTLRCRFSTHPSNFNAVSHRILWRSIWPFTGNPFRLTFRGFFLFACFLRVIDHAGYLRGGIGGIRGIRGGISLLLCWDARAWKGSGVSVSGALLGRLLGKIFFSFLADNALELVSDCECEVFLFWNLCLVFWV